jgi:hypothetical protein
MRNVDVFDGKMRMRNVDVFDGKNWGRRLFQLMWGLFFIIPCDQP